MPAPKVPYDDNEYIRQIGIIETAADKIYGMEGSTLGTVSDVFDNVLDNMADLEGDDDE